MAFNTNRNLATDLAKQTAHIAVSAVVSGGVSPGALVKVVFDVGALAWKAGAYMHHKNTVQKSLAICLEEYCKAGYLEAVTTGIETQPSTWRTTSKLREANTIHQVYPDIERYLSDEKFTEMELAALGFNSIVTISSDPAVCKGLAEIMTRLSASCDRSGVRDITNTDAHKRIEVVSAMHMGAIGLENAFIAEGQRRQRGEPPQAVPIIGRVLGLAALCGITQVALTEITTIIGKAPIFETVARSRIAKLRNAHASEVFNTLLFNGNTESTAKEFGERAAKFSGERVIVGRVKAAGKSEFLPEFAEFCCELSGPSEKTHPVGTLISMTAGWANLIQRREFFEKQHSVFSQIVHLHSPVRAEDIHGNTYMSCGKLPKIVFSVKTLPDGTLMAKPKRFERFDYASGSNYGNGNGKTKASGQEKLFGGIVGPAMCKCAGVADVQKTGLTKNWKLGSGIKIQSLDFVGNSIAHVQEHSTKKITILWRPGDWIMGVFLIQVLPQSSYLQGKAECLYCAVENAALYGCPEVVACGGGKVSAETLETELKTPRLLRTTAVPSPVDTSLLSGKSVETPFEIPQEIVPGVPSDKTNPGTAVALCEYETQVKIPSQVKAEVPPNTYKAVERAVALFDYEAQEWGDLSFARGDVIEILVRTPTEVGWWTGLLNGREGKFPGNYVRVEPPQPATPTKPTPVITSDMVKLDRVTSTESNPASPPPAYGSMSPSPPTAGFDYFAISDSRGDKVIQRPLIRRKPVGSGSIDLKQTKAQLFAPDLKTSDAVEYEEINPWLVRPRVGFSEN